MLALCVAFAAVLAAAWFLVIAPLVKSHSATIAKGSDDAVEKLRSAAYEFVDLEGDRPDEVPVLVLYATEYGFAREVARKTASVLARKQVDVGPSVEYPLDEEPKVLLRPRIVNTLDYAALDFTKETLVLMVVSTTGDGVPPNESEEFRDALLDKSVTIPANLKYAVLALGDSSYPHFCRGGIIFEDLLRECTGVPPVLNRVDIDQEDWDSILEWSESAFNIAQKVFEEKSEQSPRNVQLTSTPFDPSCDYLVSALEKHALLNIDAAARFSRANPYYAKMADCYLLSEPDRTVPSPKTVIRVELDIDPMKISYTPGDALGILPQNNSESVARLLQVLACNGDEQVTIDGVPDPITLEEAFMDWLDLRVIRADLVARLAELAISKMEQVLAEQLLVFPSASSTMVSGVQLSECGFKYVGNRHVIDLLTDFPSAQMPVQSFVRLLRPLHARYYSISSSPLKNDKVIAATLDVVRYQTRGVAREGVASTFLNERVRVGEEVKMFISKNVNFRLPEDKSHPIIMIGPGTGIAPFMSFLEEREESGASGKNLLFFGCRHERHDFLYKNRLKKWAQDGFLELVTAFSRDSTEKVYVTHRLVEKAEDVWTLIDKHNGFLYVCGDGNRMAKDVHDALKQIIETQGNRSADEAEEFLEKLSSKRRYQRDVWVS